MTCERTEASLSALLDGELPVSEEQEVNRHLSSCPECRQELDSLRRLSRLLAARTDPDPSFIARFRLRLEQEARAGASLALWKRLGIRLLPLAAAAALAAGAAAWLSVEESSPLAELEASLLGEGFPATEEEAASLDPVLRIAIEPFPGGER